MLQLNGENKVFCNKENTNNINFIKFCRIPRKQENIKYLEI